jgi:hypothetical protein
MNPRVGLKAVNNTSLFSPPGIENRFFGYSSCSLLALPLLIEEGGKKKRTE